MKITLVNRGTSSFKFIISEVTKIIPLYMRDETALLIYENGECTERLRYIKQTDMDNHEKRCMDDFELIRQGIREKEVFAISPDGMLDEQN